MFHQRCIATHSFKGLWKKRLLMSTMWILQQGQVVRGCKCSIVFRHSSEWHNSWMTSPVITSGHRTTKQSRSPSEAEWHLFALYVWYKQIRLPYWLTCFISCHASGVTFSLITSYLQWHTQQHNGILRVYMQLQSQFSCRGTKETED